jgi:uncharacterized protein
MTPDPLSPPVLAAAFLMGLLGAPHCLGMCGGVAAALVPSPVPAGGPRRGHPLAMGLALGRIATYAGLGVVVGSLGQSALHAIGGAAAPAVRIGLGAVLLLSGLSLAGLWPRALAFVEGPGGWLHAAVRRWTRGVLPVSSPARALAAGAVWGLLPCGLVYGALAGAAALATPWGGGAFMTSFGLGTLPAVLSAGWVGGGARALAQRRGVRGAAGWLLIAAGVWTLAAPLVGHPFSAHAGDATPAASHSCEA